MMLDHATIAAAFERHARVGFQFSGGRDSTAALYVLREFWPRMTVYHLDTGDQFPETRDVVARVAQDLPIVVIRTDVAALREQFGMPSDIVPVDNTSIGRMVSGQAQLLQGRYDCCARALMVPMHEQMIRDGITLLVRGQRDDEYAAPPLRSGDSSEGFEVLYPIQSWSPGDVMEYLRAHGLPLAPFYERGMRRAPECMGCTAWWDEGRAAYMREHHPAAFGVYEQRIRIVRAQIHQQARMLVEELEACDG
jgi:phosphoadenosine phosphosulfate reductase